MHTLVQITLESWSVLGQMAPYLLLGFLVAGILSVCIPATWVERHLGGRRLGPVLKASLLGVPLPLCSCGVIPVAASIRRHGASRGATTAFLLSTPQTGVDSIAVTYALLGPLFAVFRPIAALVTGLIGGYLVQFFECYDDGDIPDDEPTAANCTEPCCAEGPAQNIVWRALHYGFLVLPRDIGTALMIGVILTGIIGAVVSPGQLADYLGGGLLSILLLMLAGMPLYVCATASAPIALGFIHAGASPGAALAFLIAGPATNAATLSIIWKLLGRHTAVVYLATVALGAVVCGMTLDWLFPTLGIARPVLGMHEHASDVGRWTHFWAVALLAVMVGSSKTVARLLGGDATLKAHRQEQSANPLADGYQRFELNIAGMTCDHCVESVRGALAHCTGVHSADVDLGSGRAVVVGPDIDPRQLIVTVERLGYQATVRD